MWAGSRPRVFAAALAPVAAPSHASASEPVSACLSASASAPVSAQRWCRPFSCSNRLEPYHSWCPSAPARLAKKPHKTVADQDTYCAPCVLGSLLIVFL